MTAPFLLGERSGWSDQAQTNGGLPNLLLERCPMVGMAASSPLTGGLEVLSNVMFECVYVLGGVCV